MSSDADRLRITLAKLDLSQRAAAAALELPERTLRHYAQGHGRVPAYVWLALRALELERAPKQ